MTIPEGTLEGWTTQGAVTNSKRTYQSVQNAVNNERYGLGDFEHNYRIHLQGSYANHTNLWGSNDVDVVVKLTKPFEEDLSGLSLGEKQRFWDQYSESDYTFQEFYQTVLAALKNYFGIGNVDPGSKAIKVKSNDETNIPVDADVVACVEYRNYNAFPENGEENWTEGMYFKTQQLISKTIINYSEEHRRNGSQKNGNTNMNYKPTIRMFKKARDHAISRDYIGSNAVSSYYIEGLLFNIANSKFKMTSLQDRYLSVVEYLEASDVTEFEEQSKQYDLCVDHESERWNVSDAEDTIWAFRELWEEW
ncbi:nucleotidyltransferase domain-containing protein [Natronosalvus amylolyticus]|uniref:nucleotidyltransferase domain-containing protein n=1 Tax=Natronosalvus amylolyticus TaxID=2961994 RepID=UPI0020C96998|nr:nucleotidyltransferase [Natronosalvus amylolyticus]